MARRSIAARSVGKTVLYDAVKNGDLGLTRQDEKAYNFLYLQQLLSGKEDV